jgi:hypothetical protein
MFKFGNRRHPSSVPFSARQGQSAVFAWVRPPLFPRAGGAQFPQFVLPGPAAGRSPSESDAETRYNAAGLIATSQNFRQLTTDALGAHENGQHFLPSLINLRLARLTDSQFGMRFAARLVPLASRGQWVSTSTTYHERRVPRLPCNFVRIHRAPQVTVADCNSEPVSVTRPVVLGAGGKSQELKPPRPTLAT